MKRLDVLIGLLLAVNLVAAYFLLRPSGPVATPSPSPVEVFTPSPGPGPGQPAVDEFATTDLRVELVCGDLRFPTSFTWLPGTKDVLCTELTGGLRMLRDWQPLPDPVLSFDVNFTSDRGLLAVELAPDFASTKRFYIYHSYGQSPPHNRVVLCQLDGDRATVLKTVIDGIPSGGVHNGGGLRFGPDGKLYASTGDGIDEGQAVEPLPPLGGKVLRVNPDGTIPADNPVKDSPIWADGFRNAFGLDFDTLTGRLYCTDNGPDVDDEVDMVVKGGHYGWPRTTGFKPPAKPPEKPYEQPVASFETTMGITGVLLYRGKELPGYDGKAFVGDYKFGFVWVLDLAADGVTLKGVRHIPGAYGIVTNIYRGPDGYVYFGTFNGIYRLLPAGPRA